MKGLDNLSFSLPKKGDSVDLKIGDSEYKITLNDDQIHSSIRPIISNENHINIGNPFVASFSLSRNLPLKPQDQSPPV